MRELFTMDKKDYDPAGSRFRRPSARGILLQGGKILLVRDGRHGYYKFPGGGIDPGETPVQALIREVREEAGRIVIEDSVREYGLVRRLEKGNREEIFEQENYYYFCRAEDAVLPLALDDYEREDGFAPELVDPREAAAVNRAFLAGDGAEKCRREAERECRVLELLIREGIFAGKGAEERFMGLSPAYTQNR